MKLLLVEDDPRIAESVHRGFELEGFTVDVAVDGDDGWWMATESTYDVIVLDVMLPRRDGFTVCKELRELDDWTPIVMLTAKDDQCSEIKGLGVGADDYLTKPFSFPVLLARVRAALRRAQHRRAAPVTVGRLRTDPECRRVWADDTELQLTQREYEVLEFLTRRAGHVLSKDEIISGVWQFDFDGNPNIVDVYVGRLRRKLRAVLDDDVIRTVRGLGYRVGASVD